MKKLTKLILVLAQLGLIGAAQAGSISLIQVDAPANKVSFKIDVDFTDTPTIGGNFDLTYDASLLGSLGSETFAPSSAFITGVSIYTPTVSSGLITGLGFGGLVSTSGTLGTVTFSILDSGLASLASRAAPITESTNNNFRNATGSSFILMDYGRTTVQVSAVPVPAALWLMASGLSALGLGMRRRRA